MTTGGGRAPTERRWLAAAAGDGAAGGSRLALRLAGMTIGGRAFAPGRHQAGERPPLPRHPGRPRASAGDPGPTERRRLAAAAGDGAAGGSRLALRLAGMTTREALAPCRPQIGERPPLPRHPGRPRASAGDPGPTERRRLADVAATGGRRSLPVDPKSVSGPHSLVVIPDERAPARAIRDPRCDGGLPLERRLVGMTLGSTKKNCPEALASGQVEQGGFTSGRRRTPKGPALSGGLREDVATQHPDNTRNRLPND